MTFKNFWIDLWLDLIHGRWEVERVFSHYQSLDFGVVPIKAEGTSIDYDQGAVYLYYAVRKRTKDMILCDSKRHAEGIVAIYNDMRAT